jgi:hypothetical protein
MIRVHHIIIEDIMALVLIKLRFFYKIGVKSLVNFYNYKI